MKVSFAGLGSKQKRIIREMHSRARDFQRTGLDHDAPLHIEREARVAAESRAEALEKALREVQNRLGGDKRNLLVREFIADALAAQTEKGKE